MGVRLAAALLLALGAIPAAAQERLAVAPGDTLRFHAAPGPGHPVVDPGIAPAEIRLVAGNLGAGAQPRWAVVRGGDGCDHSSPGAGPACRDAGWAVRQL